MNLNELITFKDCAGQKLALYTSDRVLIDSWLRPTLGFGKLVPTPTAAGYEVDVEAGPAFGHLKYKVFAYPDTREFPVGEFYTKPPFYWTMTTMAFKGFLLRKADNEISKFCKGFIGQHATTQFFLPDLLVETGREYLLCYNDWLCKYLLILQEGLATRQEYLTATKRMMPEHLYYWYAHLEWNVPDGLVGPIAKTYGYLNSNPDNYAI